MNGTRKNPIFERRYDLNSIEYRFKFWDTDEREIHRQIIQLLEKGLEDLRLAGEKKENKGTPFACPVCKDPNCTSSHK